MSRSGVQDPTISARIVERPEWWAAVDSNHLPPRYQHGALPVELAAQAKTKSDPDRESSGSPDFTKAAKQAGRAPARSRPAAGGISARFLGDRRSHDHLGRVFRACDRVGQQGPDAKNPMPREEAQERVTK